MRNSERRYLDYFAEHTLTYCQCLCYDEVMTVQTPALHGSTQVSERAWRKAKRSAHH